MFYGDGPELAAYMKKDIAQWTQLMKIANIQPQ
jgi:tripartite-type tricarboxylate transporter receptor subunit TctC